MGWQVLLLALKARWYVVDILDIFWLTMLTVEQMVLWATNLQSVRIFLIRISALLNDLSQVISHLHDQLDLWTQFLFFERCACLILGFFKILLSLQNFGISLFNHTGFFLILGLSDSLPQTAE